MKNGIKKLIGNILWYILLAGILLAVYRVVFKDSSVDEVVRKKSQQVDNKVHEKGGILDYIECFFTGTPCPETKINTPQNKNNNKTDATTKTQNKTKEEPVKEVPVTTSAGNKKNLDEISKETYEKALANLEKISIKDPEKVNYSRKEWKHWSSAGAKCWDTREEALRRQAKSVVLLDKDKKETTDTSKACYIKSGEWYDKYSGTIITDPKAIDIDHMIPLSYASQHGGQNWSAEKKEQFANDLDNNLFVSLAKENRSKSDKGPSNYMPSNDNFHCEYSIAWITLANKYGLSVTQKDKDVLSNALSRKCVIIR